MPEQSAPLPAAGDIPVVNVPMTKSAITEATADVPDASYRISSQEIYLSGKVIVSVNPDTGARHRP